MKQLLAFLFIGLGLSSCASYQLALSSDRQVTYKLQTNLSKSKAHSKVNEWVAKSFNNANNVIKMNDKDEGKLIVKGISSCDITNPPLAAMGGDPQIAFTMISTTVDKEVTIQFVDVSSITSSGSTGWYPANKQEMDKLSSNCLEPYSKEIEAALK